MKTILCYGDSNTWGFDPALKDRFPAADRWTGVMSRKLGKGFTVIEEGLGGRTTVWDDPVEGGFKSGKDYLIPCLESHRPIDLVILWLGINDLKKRYSLPLSDVVRGVSVLIELILGSGAGPSGQAPRLLLLSPLPLGKLSEDYEDMFEGAAGKSARLPELYRQTAERYGCAYADASEIVSADEADGLHLSRPSHKTLGRALAAVASDLLSRID